MVLLIAYLCPMTQTTACVCFCDAYAQIFPTSPQSEPCGTSQLARLDSQDMTGLADRLQSYTRMLLPRRVNICSTGLRTTDTSLCAESLDF